jgi:hypothetical protein
MRRRVAKSRGGLGEGEVIVIGGSINRWLRVTVHGHAGRRSGSALAAPELVPAANAAHMSAAVGTCPSSRGTGEMPNASLTFDRSAQSVQARIEVVGRRLHPRPAPQPGGRWLGVRCDVHLSELTSGAPG